MKRCEQKPENCWRLEDMYVTEDLWHKEYDYCNNEMNSLGEFSGRLGESGAVLLRFLEKDREISRKVEKVYVYAAQKSHEDMGNSLYQDLSKKAMSLMVKKEGITSFFHPELLELSDELLNTFSEEKEELAYYQGYFDQIRRKRAHILSGEMEELLANVAEVAEVANDTFGMFNNADLKFPSIVDENQKEQVVTHGNYIVHLQNPNRQVRKSAFESMYQSYKAYENTLASLFRGNLKQFTFFAKTRKYENSLVFGLDGANIPVSVYTSLIESVHSRLPLLHRYMALRKKAMNLKELHMYDLYVPLISEVEMKVPFEEAKEMVKKGLKPLGEEYLSLLEKGFQNGWIDVYENEGKRSGAYSWGTYDSHPYVLLNYQGNLNHVFTLAHEMGHALHSYYSTENQGYEYAGYKIFVAEVASTCNEALLIHDLLENCQDEKEKAYLIQYFMEQFRGTLFRQTMFAEFEMITHDLVEKGEVLTAEKLSEIYMKLNQQYFGDAVVVDQEIAMEWSRIPHFYRSFYVYQYATGFSAAVAISGKILAGDQEVLSGYLKFLQSGCKMDPIDLLKLAKVDMTQKEPVENALVMFEQLLIQLEDYYNI